MSWGGNTAWKATGRYAAHRGRVRMFKLARGMVTLVSGYGGEFCNTRWGTSRKQSRDVHTGFQGQLNADAC